VTAADHGPLGRPAAARGGRVHAGRFRMRVRREQDRCICGPPRGECPRS
jgi:hypothetical protein